MVFFPVEASEHLFYYRSALSQCNITTWFKLFFGLFTLIISENNADFSIISQVFMFKLVLLLSICLSIHLTWKWLNQVVGGIISR